jgi:hypothetical protein
VPELAQRPAMAPRDTSKPWSLPVFAVWMRRGGKRRARRVCQDWAGSSSAVLSAV